MRKLETYTLGVSSAYRICFQWGDIKVDDKREIQAIFISRSLGDR